jgi:branched-chain amino acid aminotransferase
MIVYLNDQWLNETAAFVSINDQGFLHGDGVFETARLHRGGYFRLRSHLERLAAGAALLHITLSPLDHLAEVAVELARRNRLEDGTLRITLTRGVIGQPPTLLATVRPIAPEWQRRAERGWRLVTASTRRPSIASVPAQLKSMGRVYALLARLEERPAGTDDVLLLAESGAICEGPAWNIFWRRGSVLRTPALEVGVLDGITRSVLIAIAAGAGFTVEQAAWPRAELDTAEEAFVTMSSVGVVPVRMLDGHALPSDAAARLLQARYWDLVAREIAPRREQNVHDRRSS